MILDSLRMNLEFRRYFLMSVIDTTESIVSTFFRESGFHLLGDFIVKVQLSLRFGFF
jgi:hypothetical protein